MLRIFKGDLENEFVVRASENLEEERARLESLKTRKERVQDLDIQLSTLRGTVGSTAQELAKAHQQAQEAQSRVDRLEAELQASLEEVKRLEVQQDQYKSQIPFAHTDRPAQAESPEERACAIAIDYLMHHGGSTMHVQQCLNELRDKYLRLSASRVRTQAVQEDSLEHGLSEDPPWQPQEGSPIRESLVNHGSLETQRHVSHMLAQKNAQHKKQGKGSKGKGKDSKTDVRAHEASATGPGASSPAASSTTAGSTPAQSSMQQPPPWRDRPPPIPEEESNEMGDSDRPARGAKRPAEPTAPPEDPGLSTAGAAAEEDEFQEAARYRRGDGHLA